MLHVRALVVSLTMALSAVAALAESEPWLTREIPLSRAGTEHEWPFSVDEGRLQCFIFSGMRTVFFKEPDRNDPDWFFKGIPYKMPRSVIVSVNPLEIFAGLEDADLFLPFDSDFAVLIRRLAPFAAMGQALCEELLAEQADKAAGDEN